MLDLSSVPDALLIARGKYSTVRSAHEDEMKRLSCLTGELSSIASQVLKRMQPDNGEPVSVDDLLDTGRNVLNSIESCASNIAFLAKQRNELKPIAWPK